MKAATRTRALTLIDPHPVGRAFEGDEAAFALHEVGKVAQLAARCCTQVDGVVAGLRVELVAGHRGGKVL
eukprot:m.152282 g.152282  ORF g.152282 m.152282 type:complete len:70 (-) comp17436_c0_seq3:85-294(-)